MFSANDERVIAMLTGRKMDQTPTLQFSCGSVQGRSVFRGGPFWLAWSRLGEHADSPRNLAASEYLRGHATEPACSPILKTDRPGICRPGRLAWYRELGCMPKLQPGFGGCACFPEGDKLPRRGQVSGVCSRARQVPVFAQHLLAERAPGRYAASAQARCGASVSASSDWT